MPTAGGRTARLVLSGLLAQDGRWTYRSLAERLGVAHPVVQRALDRAGSADLYSADRRNVHLAHFEEFALHVLRFVAPAELGRIVPGAVDGWSELGEILSLLDGLRAGDPRIRKVAREVLSTKLGERATAASR